MCAARSAEPLSLRDGHGVWRSACPNQRQSVPRYQQQSFVGCHYAQRRIRRLFLHALHDWSWWGFWLRGRCACGRLTRKILPQAYYVPPGLTDCALDSLCQASPSGESAHGTWRASACLPSVCTRCAGRGSGSRASAPTRPNARGQAFPTLRRIIPSPERYGVGSVSLRPGPPAPRGWPRVLHPLIASARVWWRVPRGLRRGGVASASPRHDARGLDIRILRCVCVARSRCTPCRSGRYVRAQIIL